MDYFFLSTLDEEAKDNPMIAIMDGNTGDKYARAAGKKGIDANGEIDCLILDMAEAGPIGMHIGN